MRNLNTIAGIDNSGNRIIKLEFDYLTGDNRYFLTSSFSSSFVTGSDNFFVTNVLKVSGTIINTTGDLLLSSSSTSQITISGNLNILGYIQQSNLSSFTASMIQASASFANVSSSYNSLSSSYTQTSASYGAASSSFASAINNISGTIKFIGDTRYILTGTAGTQIVTSPLIFSGSILTSGSISAYAGPLILSSSNGSVVVISSSMDFPNGDKNYHLRSVNTDLILSSSKTSQITVSGSLSITGSVTINSGPLFPPKVWFWANLSSSEVSDTAKFDSTGKGVNSYFGWAICNGNNGTPNLLLKFIRCSLTGGNTGGEDSNSHTHSVTSNVTSDANTGAHTLTPTEMPTHHHLGWGSGGSGATLGAVYNASLSSLSAQNAQATQDVGGGGSHTHPSPNLTNNAVTSGTPSDTENRPAYYEQVPLMKLP